MTAVKTLAAPTSARRVIPVMGTVVSVDVRQIDQPAAQVDETLAAVESWLHQVNRIFSTYQADSQVSRLARRELRLADCHPDVAVVLAACAQAQADTEGAFSAMASGRLDPTGLVKGWAAQRASDALCGAGLTCHAINAGGDVICSGEPEPGQPWRVGISDPVVPGRLSAVALLHPPSGTAALATSGPYERGAHIIDPRTRRPAAGIRSASVVGPNLTRADAYATALCVEGRPNPAWLRRLSDYSTFVLTDDGGVHCDDRFPLDQLVRRHTDTNEERQHG